MIDIVEVRLLFWKRQFKGEASFIIGTRLNTKAKGETEFQW